MSLCFFDVCFECDCVEGQIIGFFFFFFFFLKFMTCSTELDFATLLGNYHAAGELGEFPPFYKSFFFFFSKFISNCHICLIVFCYCS